jgi:hypothetical protein
MKGFTDSSPSRYFWNFALFDLYRKLPHTLHFVFAPERPAGFFRAHPFADEPPFLDVVAVPVDDFLGRPLREPPERNFELVVPLVPLDAPRDEDRLVIVKIKEGFENLPSEPPVELQPVSWCDVRTILYPLPMVRGLPVELLLRCAPEDEPLFGDTPEMLPDIEYVIQKPSPS